MTVVTAPHVRPRFSVVDNTPPEVTCPDDLTIECGESLIPGEGEGENLALADWLASATGTDNCGGVTLVTTSYTPDGFTDDCGETGMQVVTFYLEDDCGNPATCQATVIIVDTTDPDITCPEGDLEVECTADLDPAKQRGDQKLAW